MASDSSATVQLGVQEAGATGAESVAWHIADPGALGGVTVSPASGTLNVVKGRSVTPLRVSSGVAGDVALTFDLTQGGRSLPDLTLDVDVSPTT
jgi:hypothetical protein